MKTIHAFVIVLLMSTFSLSGFAQTETKDQKPTVATAQENYSNGVTLMKEFKYQEAITFFDMAIKEKDDMASAYYYRAVCKCNLGLKAEACPDLKKASELGHYVEKVAIPCDCDAKDPNKK